VVEKRTAGRARTGHNKAKEKVEVLFSNFRLETKKESLYLNPDF